MSMNFFFQEVPTLSIPDMDDKIQQVISLIESNASIEADKTLAAIENNNLEFRSYFELTKEEYENCASDLKLSEGVELPTKFPPTNEAISVIERYYPGSIYGNVIYLNSKLSARILATIIVHEICHFRTESCYEKDMETYDEQTAEFVHEFRAVAAEYRFKNKTNRLSHEELIEIIEDTADRYPDLVNEMTYEASYNSKGCGSS